MFLTFSHKPSVSLLHAPVSSLRPANAQLHFPAYNIQPCNHLLPEGSSDFFYFFLIYAHRTISPLSREQESLENYCLADSLFLLPPTQREQQAKHLRLLLLEKNNSAIISMSDFRHLEFGKAHLYLLQFHRGAENSGKLY